MRIYYPDAYDEIPAGTVVRPSALSGEPTWLEMDLRLIERAAAVRASPASRALDVGAGRGRLAGAIAGIADEVVCLEPDKARAAALALSPVGRSVTVVCSPVQSYRPTEPFDLIVCSHVLQHLRARARLDAVSAIRRLCDGECVVLFCFVTSDRPRSATFASFTGCGSGPVTYELGARTGLRSMPTYVGVVPLITWHAGKGQMERMLERHGFGLVERGVYRRFHHRVTGTDAAVRNVAAADAYAIAIAT